MAEINNLIVLIESTSRAGATGIVVNFRVRSADDSVDLYRGALRFGDATGFKEALRVDAPEFEDALLTVLRAAISAGGLNTTTFDALAGKKFRIQSRAVLI